MSDPVSLVTAFFDDLTAGRLVEALEERTTEDFRWENSGLPTAEGRDAAIGMMRGFMEGFGMASLRVETLAIAAVGNVVLSERIDHIVDAAGATLLSVPLAGSVEVRDGKISRWTDYADPRPLLPPA